MVRHLAEAVVGGVGGPFAKDAGAAAKDKAAATTQSARTEVAKAADTAQDKAVAAKAEVAEAVKADEEPKPPRSMDEIEADIAKARESLAGKLDDLQDYVNPKNVLSRQVDKVKGVFVDEYGGIKPDKVAIAVGVVVAIVGISVLRRRRRRG